MFKKLVILMVCFIGAEAMAANKGYYGKVLHIILSQTGTCTHSTDTEDQVCHEGSSFFVYIDNQDIIDNCAYGRVRFDISVFGVGRTKAAFSMATTALVSDRQFGVVVNLDALSPTGGCDVAANTSTGAMLK